MSNFIIQAVNKLNVSLMEKYMKKVRLERE